MFEMLDEGHLVPPPKWGLARMQALGMDPDDWYNRSPG